MTTTAPTTTVLDTYSYRTEVADGIIGATITVTLSHTPSSRQPYAVETLENGKLAKVRYFNSQHTARDEYLYATGL